MSSPVDTEPAPGDFDSFYRSESTRLGRALFLLIGDVHLAEDLAQEAMVRVYERWRKVRIMDSPDGYLYRVALNLHRSRLRRLVVQARRRPAPSAAPLDPARSLEVHDQLGRALASLPVKQREAVVLVEWMGMSAEEAARVLKIEPVSVRVRLSRARAALREWIEEDDADA
jgi:RNA polymerase sigma-70 factor (sigma-E family)